MFENLKEQIANLRSAISYHENKLDDLKNQLRVSEETLEAKTKKYLTTDPSDDMQRDMVNDIQDNLEAIKRLEMQIESLAKEINALNTEQRVQSTKIYRLEDKLGPAIQNTVELKKETIDGIRNVVGHMKNCSQLAWWLTELQDGKIDKLIIKVEDK